MKFGDVLSNELIPEWGHDAYIDYTSLKSLIKRLTSCSPALEGSSSPPKASDFVEQLHTNRSRIAEFFEHQLNFYSASLEKTFTSDDAGKLSEAYRDELVSRYVEFRCLQKYLRLNLSGFRKIVKKFQKHAGALHPTASAFAETFINSQLRVGNLREGILEPFLDRIEAELISVFSVPPAHAKSWLEACWWCDIHAGGRVRPLHRSLYFKSDIAHKASQHSPSDVDRLWTRRDDSLGGSADDVFPAPGAGMLTPNKPKDSYLQQSFQQCYHLLPGTVSPEFCRDVAYSLGRTTSTEAVRLSKFANGEISVQVNRPVRGDYVFLVQSLIGRAPPSTSPLREPESPTTSVSRPFTTNDSVMELVLMAQACALASSKHIAAVIPYLGYSRRDDKRRSRVPISISAVLNMLSTVGVHRLITVNLHAGQIQGFFKGQVENLDPKLEFAKCFLDLYAPVVPRSGELLDVTVVAPAARAVPSARAFADSISAAHVATCMRSRADDSMRVIGTVCDICVIYDDIIDTAWTVCRAAEALQKGGARRVYVMATHGVLSGNAVSRIQNCDAITEVIVSDTIDQSGHMIFISKLRVLSLGAFVAETLRRIMSGQSIIAMYEEEERPSVSSAIRKMPSLGDLDSLSDKHGSGLHHVPQAHPQLCLSPLGDGSYTFPMAHSPRFRPSDARLDEMGDDVEEAPPDSDGDQQ